MTSKNELYKDNLLSITRNKKNNILYFTWSNQCTNLLQHDFKEKIGVIQQVLEKEKPERILMNLHSCEYFLEPDNYRWYEKTMFSIIDLKKQIRLAIVVPQNLFVHTSFEASRIALEKEKLPVQYFLDTEKAEYWLLLE